MPYILFSNITRQNQKYSVDSFEIFIHIAFLDLIQSYVSP